MTDKMQMLRKININKIVNLHSKKTHEIQRYI